VSSTFDEPTPSRAEALRRSFAQAWGEIGAAWGVAPSTATVQGYLLVTDGPLSEPEVRRALGMSHRAASMALAQCEEWGLIERAQLPRRSGQRGPAATAWNVVDDHWEWFRRVAIARKVRETDPVLPVIERCVSEARALGDSETDPDLAELGERFASLLEFVERFDRGVEIFVRGDARSVERVFAALSQVDDATIDRLWRLVAELEPDEMVRAAESLATLSPAAARRLIMLADQPVLRKLVGLA
jgi:DNA-binding transcriptional regulator GbsR (MarR family)